jgi:hypothetical protein
MIVNRARSSVLMTESFFRCFNDEEIECDKFISSEITLIMKMGKTCRTE